MKLVLLVLLVPNDMSRAAASSEILRAVIYLSRDFIALDPAEIEMPHCWPPRESFLVNFEFYAQARTRTQSSGQREGDLFAGA